MYSTIDMTLMEQVNSTVDITSMETLKAIWYVIVVGNTYILYYSRAEVSIIHMPYRVLYNK